MKNQKRSFVLYFDAEAALSRLDMEQRGWLLTALYRYAQTVTEIRQSPLDALAQYPGMKPETQLTFLFMAGSILRDTIKWENRRRSGASAPDFPAKT